MIHCEDEMREVQDWKWENRVDELLSLDVSQPLTPRDDAYHDLVGKFRLQSTFGSSLLTLDACKTWLAREDSDKNTTTLSRYLLLRSSCPVYVCRAILLKDC